MTTFRHIDGINGLSAHELGAFGRPTGGWRIYRHGAALADVPSEIDARIMLAVLGGIRDGDAAWNEARRDALAMMFREAA